MTIKILSGVYYGPGNGYVVFGSTSFTGFSVTSTGTLKGVHGTDAPAATGSGSPSGGIGYAGLVDSATAVPFVNSGQIIGGRGGAGGTPANSGVIYGSNGGFGGIGAKFGSGGYLHNLGTIAGGVGGAGGGGDAQASFGGEGVSFYGMSTLTNAGLITGGAGGGGGPATTGTGAGVSGKGGNGSVGVTMNLGVLNNTGSIVGGAGGGGGLGGTGGYGGLGSSGVETSGNVTITNSGHITGGAGGIGGFGTSVGGHGGNGNQGVAALSGGLVINTGVILGGAGGAGGAAGFHGKIGIAGQAGDAVYFQDGGTFVNGSSSATNAYTGGFVGVLAAAAGIVVVNNYGTIEGSNNAISFTNSGDILVDQPNSVLIGEAFGHFGELEMAPGVGTFGGFGTLGTASSFENFGLVQVDAGGSWTLTGSNEVIPLGTLAQYGALTLTGSLQNQGTIKGTASTLVQVAAGGTIVNYRTINASGTGLAVYGYAKNTSTAGKIASTYRGVYVGSGGDFYNATSSQVDAPTGVFGHSGSTILNAGSVTSSNVGVVLFGGGSLRNNTGYIYGKHAGVGDLGGSVTNVGLGYIRSLGAGINYGGVLMSGGSLYNQNATVVGYSAVLGSDLTVTNKGLLKASVYAGVYVITGSTSGTITNSGGGTIAGGKFGVLSKSAGVTVVNDTSIYGSKYSVDFASAGDTLVMNGGSLTGVATGGGGTLVLNVGNPTTITNLGGLATIGANGTFTDFGRIDLKAGYEWVIDSVAGPQTVANYGFLKLGAGVTLAAGGRLIAEAGSGSYGGPISGGGSTLELNDGGVTISGMGGTATIGGSMTVTGFGTYQFDAGYWSIAGAANSTTSMVTQATADVIMDGGATLKAQGMVANAGTITIGSTTINTDLRIQAAGATLSGGGQVVMIGSKARILGVTAASTLTNVDNIISGTGFIGANSLTLINQAKGVIDAVGASGLTVGTKGSTLTNQGLMEATGGGILAIVNTAVANVGGVIMATNLSPVKLQTATVQGGSLIATGSGVIKFNVAGGELDGTKNPVSLSGVAFIVNGSNETLVGSIANAGKINLIASTSTSDLIIGAAGATLSGGGQVNMTNSLSNRIYGLASGDTLTNVDNRIDGAGLIGNGVMTLINNAKGQIVGNQNLALTIDTGTNTILNAGLIENVGKGGTLVKSAVNNTGTLLAATAGTLNFAGAVTGAGIGQISGGTLYVQQAFAENVTFSGSTGVLELGDSQAFTGKVTGLSHTGTSWLDLVDIGFFSTKTKATFSGTTASGTLTVTDGTHTAHIALIGNYIGATWTTSSDGHGGTKVVDPPAGAAPLAQAMASIASGPPVAASRNANPAPRLMSLVHAP